MTLRRVCTLFLLLYVTVDYSDPSLPGVFSFDTDVYYVDGVVDARCAATPVTPVTPLSSPLRAEPRLTAERVVTRVVAEMPSVRAVAGRARLRQRTAPPLAPTSEDH